MILFFGRLDEDGKVLSPEEILYRVSELRLFGLICYVVLL